MRDDQAEPSEIYLQSLSSGSRPTMRAALRDIARFFGWADQPQWEQMTYTDTQALRAHLAETYAPSTANRYLAAMRGVLRECFRLGLMDEVSFRRVTAIRPVRGSREASGRSVSQSDLGRLFSASNAYTPLGARNAAILALLYGTGARVSELVGLDLEDLDFEASKVMIRKGKGNRARSAFIRAPVLAQVRVWLGFRGDAPGPLFVKTKGGGHSGWQLLRERLSADGIRHMLKSLSEASGSRHYSPHDLRRTFVTTLLSAGVDVFTVQRMAGHASPLTTARYDRRPETVRKEAAEHLPMPDGCDGPPRPGVAATGASVYMQQTPALRTRR